MLCCNKLIAINRAQSLCSRFDLRKHRSGTKIFKIRHYVNEQYSIGLSKRKTNTSTSRVLSMVVVECQGERLSLYTNKVQTEVCMNMHGLVENATQVLHRFYFYQFTKFSFYITHQPFSVTKFIYHNLNYHNIITGKPNAT